MVCARVIVLPDPVTPSRVWYLSPRRRPSVSSRIALGWSPAGSNGATTSKRGLLIEGIYTAGISSGRGLFQPSHHQQLLPLRFRDRNDRQSRLPDQREIGENGIGFDGGQGDGLGQAPVRFHVDHGQLSVRILGIGVGLTYHSRQPDNFLLGPGVIDHQRVAQSHAPDVPEGHRIAHPIPDRALLPFQLLEGVHLRVGLENPAVQAGGASRRSISVTPFTFRTDFMTLPRWGRLSTSTKMVPNTDPSRVCRSAPRILVPVWLIASMMSAYRPRRSSPVTASRTANASPAVSCQSMSTRRSSAARVSKLGQSDR